MEKETKLIRVGITIGDVNGIGPEVIIKALSDNRIALEFTPIIYASTRTISYHKKMIREDEFAYQSCKSADEALVGKINILNVWNDEIRFEIGSVSEIGGKYAFASLERATKDLAENKIDVLVTAPISKEAIALAGFTFPGHTEYLAHLSNQEESLMMMISEKLKVALVTSHIPLAEVSKAITEEKIISKIQALENSLKKDFGHIRPRIAVLGVNPHAGENGKLGKEENEIIQPAIEKMYQQGILAFGPYPADGFFGSSQFQEFDAVLAMYHDQGLTGFKAITFDEGVNFTAGLPIVRTSPDHGTAFDIAGKGIASCQSMRNALYLAVDIYKQRKFIKEINQNPLKEQKTNEFKRKNTGTNDKIKNSRPE
jgi:4-hydroxythreonine-4-phosphate dehydrogenase